MTICTLTELERQAHSAGLVLRLKVSRPLNFWALRLVVADYPQPDKVRILGEMKAWAYGGVNGLQLDTMRVSASAPRGVGHLVWAATMAWALEDTPCRKARLLAIRDAEKQHARLVRYFLMRGFYQVREISATPTDFPLRMIWGGSGALMVADCTEILKKSFRLWQSCSYSNEDVDVSSSA